MKNHIRIETIRKPKGRSDILYTLKKTGLDAGAHILLTHLEWDSRIFGFKIGRLAHTVTCLNDSERSSLFGKLLRDCEKRGYRHLHCRIGFDEVGLLHCLEDLGFNVADIQLTLSTKGRFNGIARFHPSGPVSIRQAALSDMKDLRRVAKGAFTHTRFARDRRYPRADVDKMYSEWVSNSLHNAGQKVFSAYDGQERCVVGFVIVASGAAREPGRKIGYIDLIAVKNSARRRGIGTMLAAYALNHIKGAADLAEVRTQISNYAGIATFRKSGFTEIVPGCLLPAGISLHYWFNDRPRSETSALSQ
ncbi:MAG: GNAT family N-acetyltransferase [Candidatus Omnitrophota bacterium]|nr:GNAT family N-acetyltransferase [Candidatus Omnitrophota bacterium]